MPSQTMSSIPVTVGSSGSGVGRTVGKFLQPRPGRMPPEILGTTTVSLAAAVAAAAVAAAAASVGPVFADDQPAAAAAAAAAVVVVVVAVVVVVGAVLVVRGSEVLQAGSACWKTSV